MDEEYIETKIKEKNAMLHEWRNMAKNYSWLHQRSYRHFQKINLFIMVPIIILSTASGAINFTQVTPSTKDCEEQDDRRLNILSLILGVAGLAAAGLSTIYNFLRIGERIESHQSTAADFEKLARDISVQTLLSNTEDKTYANLGEFIKECNDRFNRLVEMAPVIPDGVYTVFEKKQGEHMKKTSQNLRIRRSMEGRWGLPVRDSVDTANFNMMQSKYNDNSPPQSTGRKSPYKQSILFPTKSLETLLAESNVAVQIVKMEGKLSPKSPVSHLNLNALMGNDNKRPGPPSALTVCIDPQPPLKQELKAAAALPSRASTRPTSAG
jgi:hypothetical protein